MSNQANTKFIKYFILFQNQAKLAYEELRQAPGLRPIMPQGAMYMMIEIKISQFSEFKNECQFVERLVSEQSVFCLPGTVIFFAKMFKNSAITDFFL